MCAKKFKSAIEEYASELKWKVVEMDNNSAILEFESDSGDSTKLYLDYDKGRLVFSVPSAAVFDEEEDILDEVSTLLLKRNVQASTGFWALEELEDGWQYILYHDQKLPVKDFELDMSLEMFDSITKAMLDECEEFNEIWEEEDW